MKLPAVAIAALFALGIAFGLSPYAAHQASSHRFIILLFGVITAALFAGLFLAFLKKFVLATVASITCWTLLGFTGAVFDQQPTRLDHLLQLADAGKVDLKSPLRCFGQLRDEPANLPWGTSYELRLSAVESEGALVPATGGLRISYIRRVVKKTEAPSSGQSSEFAISQLHAGDAVAVLTQARLPSVTAMKAHSTGAPFWRSRISI
jgi:hypothetical protein